MSMSIGARVIGLLSVVAVLGPAQAADLDLTGTWSGQSTDRTGAAGATAELQLVQTGTKLTGSQKIERIIGPRAQSSGWARSFSVEIIGTVAADGKTATWKFWTPESQQVEVKLEIKDPTTMTRTWQRLGTGVRAG
jgi:hypothetical protein